MKKTSLQKKVTNAKAGDRINLGENLELRALGSGKYFYTRYRSPVDGQNRAFKHPQAWRDVPGFIDDLLVEHRALRRSVENGEDPVLAQRSTRASNIAALNMDELFRRWYEQVGITRAPRTHAEHVYRWDRYLKPQLGAIKAQQLTKQHVAAALDKLRSRGIAEQARKSLGTLQAVTAWACRVGHMELDPASSFERGDVAPASRERDRVVSLADMRKIWSALESESRLAPETGKRIENRIHPATAAILKLLLLTACRRDEVVGMQQAELNEVTCLWEIPAARYKTGITHLVPLTPLMEQAIQQALPFTNGPHVFSGNSPDKPVSGDTITRAFARLCKRLEIPHYSPHDLRRTFTTWHHEYLGTQPHIVTALRGGIPGGTEKHYNKAQYLAERRKALERWDYWLQRHIIEQQEIEGEVVQFRERKGSRDTATGKR